ncbi:MAG: GIY-YIG nuclease family protein [Prochlorococcus marinus CUG1439]|uniref:GIY-YIG nuclease family protein n=1 Tax=Prochlorococcus sp. MIT 1314 TaxID=3096220 RepID=UPI001B1EDBBA|nr:GIY-YIG nuclease family protein [Prochlorococcus sp. MIT 1314]MCR8539957.1 GIY-YIG nuclease family protein [Prochlorococcus marinus CUG1439]
MSGYVYLIRVGDLYRIGKTDNLDKKIKKLNPDELLTSIMTKEPETLEARLLRKYKSQRIPETGYLKLSKRQIRECKKQFELKGSLPHTLDAEVSITLFASFLLFSLSSLTLNYLNFGFLKSISYAFGAASLPMVVLFVTGSFGGYFSEDFSLFSLFTNRIKGLFIAIAMLTMAYLIFNLG